MVILAFILEVMKMNGIVEKIRAEEHQDLDTSVLKLRDTGAKIGLYFGGLAGLGYAAVTKDYDGAATFIGNGIVYGAGAMYGLGLMAEPLIRRSGKRMVDKGIDDVVNKYNAE